MDSLKQMVRSRKEAGNLLMDTNLVRYHGMDEMLDMDELNGWLGKAPVLEQKSPWF